MRPKYIFITTTCAVIVTAIIFTKFLLKKSPNDAITSLQSTAKNKASDSLSRTLYSSESVAEALRIARAIAKDSTVNKEALREMHESVHETKLSYEKILSSYQEAINNYEQLSQSFDLKVRQGASAQDLAQMDHQLQAQAQKVLALKEESNDAYIALMTQVDEAIPAILEKHI